VSSESTLRPAAPAPAALEIPPGSLDGRIDLAALFGNRLPVELEVGSGKGRFLIELAAARPDTNFLGIEWSLKYLRLTRDRAAKRGVPNLRVLRADGRHVVAALIPDAALRRLHVYCPDPWPKKRHRKRRFFTPALAPHLERILEPGGFLHVSTDVGEYFEEIRAIVEEHTALRPASDPLLPPAPGGRTSYEAKHLRAGRALHRACWQRVTGSPR
jgi:tRNA (guanine-N7-)-methyltransferase